MKKYIKEIIASIIVGLLVIVQVTLNKIMFLGVMDISLVVGIEIVALVLYLFRKGTKKALIVTCVLVISGCIIYAFNLPKYSVNKAYTYLETNTNEYTKVEINHKYSTMTCKPRYGLVGSVYCFTAKDSNNHKVDIIFNPVNGKYSVSD